jgi:TPR repeat protein
MLSIGSRPECRRRAVLKSTADQNFRDPQFMYGVYLAKKMGIQQDLIEAAHYFRLATGFRYQPARDEDTRILESGSVRPSFREIFHEFERIEWKILPNADAKRIAESVSAVLRLERRLPHH